MALAALVSPTGPGTPPSPEVVHGYRLDDERDAMHVRVLGPVEVESGGETIAMSANQRLLVAVLAADAGRVVSSDVLAEALWGDNQPQKPTAALQNLVWRLRSRLHADDLDCLVTRPPGYALSLEGVRVDCVDFETHIGEARAEADPAAAIERYRAALALWQGDAFSEFADHEALQTAAVRLDGLRADATEELLGLVVRLDPVGATGELAVLAKDAPFREGVHLLLMEALYRAQRRREALEVAASFRATLVEELGLDPSPAMRALEHAILTDTLDAARPARRASDRSEVEPVVAVGDRSGNVPVRRSSFVGREHDLALVSDLLGSERLATLVGVGGTGKTSLATEVGRAVSDRFADGVWIVDLVSLKNPDRIAQHVAAAIGGVSPLSDDDPVRALVDQLGGREMLLVLDNCEHLVRKVADLVDAVLGGAEGVRVLATSREALRLPGERVVRVQPLDLPSPDASLEDVLASSAGRLFVDRARSADAAFTLEDADAAPINSVCRRLDGLPLAIELAAARVPSLGIVSLLDRLDDRFSLLTAHHRTGLPHHQTLRAAIDWSVDLLDEVDRCLLARLSVFVGSFDLPAAEAVGADRMLAAVDVPGRLAELVDRSLVVSYRTDGLVRYRLLETIREYADSELGELREAARRAHRDYYLAFAKQAGDSFLGRTTQWYQRLRADFPNLRAAYHWSLDHGEVTEALDLAGSLRWAPFNAGHLYGEFREWVEGALVAARTSVVPDDVLARAMVTAGAVAGLESRSDAAFELLGGALGRFAALDLPAEEAWCEMWLGAFLTDAGRWPEGIDHALNGLEVAQRSGASVAAAYLANQHAENAVAAAHFLPAPELFELARRSYRIALHVAEEHRVDEGAVRAEYGLALLAAVSDPVAGLEACSNLQARWRALGAGLRLILAVASSARVALLAGDLGACGRLQLEALEQIDGARWHQPLGRMAETSAVLALRTERLDLAARLTGAASMRFLTPRWHVPLPVEDLVAAARNADTAAWDEGARLGSESSDAELRNLIHAVSTA